MATPNYGYEKRQRELAKRKKKEEKALAKAERKQLGPESDASTQTGEPSLTDSPESVSQPDTGPGQT